MFRPLLCAALLTSSLVACQKETGPVDNKAIDDLTTRIKALEEQRTKDAEAMAFLHEAYGSQKKQMEEQAAQTPAPDAIFAVDIGGSQIDGPDDAMVTIIEAWDFA